MNDDADPIETAPGGHDDEIDTSPSTGSGDGDTAELPSSSDDSGPRVSLDKPAAPVGEEVAAGAAQHGSPPPDSAGEADDAGEPAIPPSGASEPPGSGATEMDAAEPELDPVAQAIAAELARIRTQKTLTWAVALTALLLPIICFSLFPPSGGVERGDQVSSGLPTANRGAIVTSTTRSTSVIRDDRQSIEPGISTTTTTTAITTTPGGDTTSSTRLSTTTTPTTTSTVRTSTMRTSTTITSTTSTSTTTSTTTTRPPQQPRQLGGIDWARWCQSAGFVRASLDQQNGYGWFCVDGQGGRHGIDTFEACERQYGLPDGLAIGQLTNYFDPNSWICWRINRQLGALTESGFRSWCRSAGYVDIRLNGSTAYDWDCVDSEGRFGGPDTRESCRFIYSSPAAIEVLVNYFDPAGWRCYT